MIVVHMDEREARRVLEALEAAERVLTTAEGLTGRGADMNGDTLRRGARALRDAIGVPPVAEIDELRPVKPGAYP